MLKKNGKYAKKMFASSVSCKWKLSAVQPCVDIYPSLKAGNLNKFTCVASRRVENFPCASNVLKMHRTNRVDHHFRDREIHTPCFTLLVFLAPNRYNGDGSGSLWLLARTSISFYSNTRINYI